MSKAKSTLSKLAPVLHLERGEFEHITRTLNTIGDKAQNALLCLEVIDKRAGSEFAESMHIIRELPESPIPGLLAAWQQARNTCAEADICRVEAEHAGTLGLPTLAALFVALGRVQEAKGPISLAEVEPLFRELLQVARGEATARIQLSLGNPTHDGVPGVEIIPGRLLERIGKGGAV